MPEETRKTRATAEIEKLNNGHSLSLFSLSPLTSTHKARSHHRDRRDLLGRRRVRRARVRCHGEAELLRERVQLLLLVLQHGHVLQRTFALAHGRATRLRACAHTHHAAAGAVAAAKKQAKHCSVPTDSRQLSNKRPVRLVTAGRTHSFFLFKNFLFLLWVSQPQAHSPQAFLFFTTRRSADLPGQRQSQDRCTVRWDQRQQQRAFSAPASALLSVAAPVSTSDRAP